jgi:hypothetical protein
MTSNRSPIVAGLLAIALLGAAVPLVPATSAGSGGTCETGEGSSQIVNEEGYVAVSHPATPSTRASQALVFFAAEDEEVVLGINAERWSNGIDAYVVDFDCSTAGNEQYCIERQLPGIEDGFRILAGQPDGEPADMRLRFYDSTFDQVGDERDPDVPAVDASEDEFCSPDVPAGAQYGVIYLRDGVPQGIQFDEQIWGVYTDHFRFSMGRAY